MRIGGDALSVDFLAEIVEALGAETTFDQRASVDPGRGVALDVDQVAAARVIGPAPEVHEADVVERSGRLEAGDMTAQLRTVLVRPQHHHRRVPTDGRADAVLDRRIAWKGGLLVRSNRVDVSGVRREGQMRSGPPRGLDSRCEQFIGPFGALKGDHRADGFDPFLHFIRIRVLSLKVFHGCVSSAG